MIGDIITVRDIHGVLREINLSEMSSVRLFGLSIRQIRKLDLYYQQKEGKRIPEGAE